MCIINEFNNLNGKKVTRLKLQKLLEKSKLLKVFEVSSRLEKALKLNKEKSFIIGIENPIQTPGLNAARHKGIAKIGLDCAGRLLPGFIFDGFGNVIPALNENSKSKNPKKRLSSSCIINDNNCNDVVENIDNTDIKTLSISKVFTDIKRFQNREELDQDVVNNIVTNYDKTQFDPIIIWFDLKQKKYFILAGHHRFEAKKLLKHKTIDVKIAKYTEAQAVKFAIEESNNNRTMEQPFERAKIYKKLFEAGTSKTQLKVKAKENESNNATKVLNLAFLSSTGIVIQTLKSLKKTPDAQSQELINTIADWIGNARFNNDKLTNAHESEMFTFLSVKENNQLFKNRTEFLHKVSSLTGMFFDYQTPLNLERFKNKTIGQSAYDVEMKELKIKVDTAVLNKQNLLDRIKNPDHIDFIKPNDKDYNSIINALHISIAKYDKEIKYFRNEIIKLSQKKGTYTNAGANQVGLFGYIQTEILKTKNLYLSKPNSFIQSHLKTNFINFNKLKVVNLETNKTVEINNVAKGKILFGGSNIDTKVATAISFLPHLITYGKLVNISKPKEHHIKNYKATQILNFQSKLNINNKTEYFIITVIDRKIDGLKYYIELANIKKSVRLHDSKLQKAKSTLSNGKEDKYNKNSIKKTNGLNSNAKFKARKQSNYTIAKYCSDVSDCEAGIQEIRNNIFHYEVFNKKIPTSFYLRLNKLINKLSEFKNINGLNKVSIPASTSVNKNSLAYKMANKPEKVDYFDIQDKDIKKLLGQIEIKPNESVFISLTGGEGSMKTRMAFQFMNCFAQNYKVGHASIEEHPESVLYYDKANEYLNAKAQSNIHNPEVKSIIDLHKLIQDNDVIVIDSFTKMKEIEKSFEVDKDLRKKYNGKLFIVIFQQTTNGSMRGGSKSQFDADIVMFTEKFDDYTKNYVYTTKNRYNKEAGLKFNIFSKQLVGNAPAIKKLSFTVK